MKITCSQFEGLISFYLNDELSDNLKQAFEEHLHNCPSCHIRFNMLSSIIDELKDAYNQIIVEDDIDNIASIELFTNIEEDNEENTQLSDLSAYIDNELNEEFSVKMRRNIIAKPKLRKKLEKLYNLRKVMSNAVDEQKNKMKTDYSKNVIRTLNIKDSSNSVYLHCVIFIMFVMFAVGFSIWALLNLI
ncbi:MAG: zf-HC2 domain-containing protein [Candidatus Gastranaerophilales bacterium]|nr:zf-HC2 domain-containing protein [Candidatus Gastranaerophilales bacterium]